MHEIVYAEGIFGFICVERSQEVERSQRIFRDMREAALSARESTGLIAEISAGMAAST
jgi:Domain of unknown function (DUF5753)